jgi:hypothetical protein
MVSLKHDARGATTQALVTVPLARFFELLCREVATACVPCSPPLAAISGLKLLDPLRVVPGPLSTASDHFFIVLLVVGTLVTDCAGTVGSCPSFLVFGDSFFVLFLVLPSRLDPVGQVGSRPLLLGVLLPTVATVLFDAALDARLALAHSAV